VKAVGVSNYSEKRLRDAHARLKKRGIPLASNQVNYSLIYRNPEENGVKAACDELGITLIAYSPIAQGALTGKYTPDNLPKGPRRRIYTPEFLTKLQPLINRIKEIGGNYERTPTQVLLYLSLSIHQSSTSQCLPLQSAGTIGKHIHILRQFLLVHSVSSSSRIECC